MMTVPAASHALPYMLSMALDDELRARATYQAVLDTHGPVPPFTQIVQAEQCHIDALLPLFARYGVTLPADRWTGSVVAPPTLQAACVAGIAGEVRNYQMYDAFLAQTAEADVRSVFTNLRNASAFRHLPAFQACAASGEVVIPAAATPPVASPPPLLAKAYVARETLPLWFGIAIGAGLVWWVSRARTVA